MKKSAMVCAVLAGTFGLASVASAQDWRGRGDDRRQDRAEQRQERREARQERREDRRERQAQRVDRAWQQGYRAAQQPRYVHQQPSYVYTQPGYRAASPRFYRGGYLPTQYRSHGHYVNDWHAHPGLYAPPSGHQWMQVGSDFLLVALATGLIANLLVN